MEKYAVSAPIENVYPNLSNEYIKRECPQPFNHSLSPQQPQNQNPQQPYPNTLPIVHYVQPNTARLA
jgi:hypothetical protein